MDDMNSRGEILQKIEQIVIDILGASDLTLSEETTAADVPGWDSLTHVQIIVGVEREFGIRMNSTEIANLKDAGSLVDLVQKRATNAPGN